MVKIEDLKLSDLDKTLSIANDERIEALRKNWYRDPQVAIEHDDFIDKASKWFLSTNNNILLGTDKFPCIDIIMGCTHFIESFCSKQKWNIQVLEKEYSYYALMGVKHTELGDLKPGTPLIVSLPNYYYGNRPDWSDVLLECEQKGIDIHIDCAWLTVAKDVKINFDHPNIKSFAMSMSKYNLGWNRIGLRWSRQRTMDSCTLISSQKKYNELTTSCGAYMMDRIPRDYGWTKYKDAVKKICSQLGLEQTNYFYLVKDKEGNLYSVGRLLGMLGT